MIHYFIEKDKKGQKSLTKAIDYFIVKNEVLIYKTCTYILKGGRITQKIHLCLKLPEVKILSVNEKEEKLPLEWRFLTKLISRYFDKDNINRDKTYKAIEKLYDKYYKNICP